MYKFVVIYYQVDEPQILEDFYAGTHLRLVEQLPGLEKVEVSRITGKPGGASRFFLMVEAYFKNRETLQQAQLSEPGLALMTALKPWSDEQLIAWFYADSFSEDKRPA